MRRFGRTSMLIGSALLVLGVAIPVSAMTISPTGGTTASGDVGALHKGGDGKQKAGKVKVTVVTPPGVPGTVVLGDHATKVVSKPAAGTSRTVTLDLPVGEVHVRARNVVVGGRLYAGRALPDEVRVRHTSTASVKVTYAEVPGARDLHVTAVTDRGISLAWTGHKGSSYMLRRVPGEVPVARPTQGVPVKVFGTKATDKGLKPGTRYSYALFTQVKGTWTGPFPLVAGTATSLTGAESVAFTTTPGTVLVKPGDVASVATTGAGVTVTFAQPRDVVLGSAVVLPVLTGLPGGFLGLVTALSDDGRTVTLTAGSMSDAFSYYSIDVPAFSVTTPAAAVASSGTTKAAGSATTAGAARSGGSDVGPFASGERKPLTPEQAAAGAASSASPGQKKAAVSAQEGSVSAQKVDCDKDAGSELVFQPSVALAGHFNAKIDTYNVLGAKLPKGASLDLQVAATVTGAMTVQTSASITCTLTLPPLTRTFTAGPVPISVALFPSGEVSLAASVKLENLGVAVTGGVELKGAMGLSSGSSFSGGPILSATPLTPKLTNNGSVSVRVGGQLLVGPGVATAKAGVVAGVSGDFNPLQASFDAVFGPGDPRHDVCLKASAEANWQLGITAKAWLKDWDITKTIDIPGLNGSHPYGTWTLPKDCDKDPVVDPGQTVLGPGVTKVEDSTTGSTTQWGHVEGFVPGKTSWVLSTGNIADALGSPAKFASTSLGGPGDDDLSQLAGVPTYDTVGYKVKLVPTGPSLHVKYVFASEEYPEYVGSSFNDVMEVLVDGKNCAMVPGTSAPVSVNTVNAGSNAEYYVDNSAGAAGYGTSMDGLTVPLTCTVPVTVGVPVTVEIKVADSSDRVYDSAVALLDQGIWSD